MEEKGYKLFKKEVVSAQNQYRAGHGCPELVVMEELGRDAQKWANTIADKGYLQYSETTGIGESISFLELNGKQPSGNELAKSWYAEIEQYDFDNPRWRKGAKHFTQMLWKGTTEIGVGIAKMKNKDQYVVVIQYRPPGNNNMPGEFQKQVPPPQKTESGHKYPE